MINIASLLCYANHDLLVHQIYTLIKAKDENVNAHTVITNKYKCKSFDMHLRLIALYYIDYCLSLDLWAEKMMYIKEQMVVLSIINENFYSACCVSNQNSFDKILLFFLRKTTFLNIR